MWLSIPLLAACLSDDEVQAIIDHTTDGREPGEGGLPAAGNGSGNASGDTEPGGDDTGPGGEEPPLPDGVDLSCVDLDYGDELYAYTRWLETSDYEDLDLSCRSGGGSTHHGEVFRWTAPTTDCYAIWTWNVDYTTDLVMEVRALACDGEVLACNDDFNAADQVYLSATEVDLVAGESVIIVVEPYDDSMLPTEYMIMMEPGCPDVPY